MALRSRQPVHLLAGVSEDDYVRSGLAVEVFAEMERVLRRADEQARKTPPRGRR